MLVERINSGGCFLFHPHMENYNRRMMSNVIRSFVNVWKHNLVVLYVFINFTLTSLLKQRNSFSFIYTVPFCSKVNTIEI